MQNAQISHATEGYTGQNRKTEGQTLYAGRRRRHVAERAPTGVVLNPTDWADIELQKDSTGQYIWVDVTTGGESKVWRLAVVPTNAIAAGNFLVGDFPAAAVVYDRQDVTIEVSREHGDNFVKNMVTILVEERLDLAVEAPGALVFGPFNGS
jgi:HK97 family phage major capsid protein